MILFNSAKNEYYYLDLYENWWNVFLLGFIWLIPHKIYKIEYLENKSKDKKLQHNFVYGLLIVVGYQISDYIQKIQIFKVHNNLRILSIPIAILFTIFFILVLSNMINRRLKKRITLSKSNLSKAKIVLKLNKSVINYFLRLIFSVFLLILIFEFSKLDILQAFIYSILTCAFNAMFLYGAGVKTTFISNDKKTFVVEKIQF